MDQFMVDVTDIPGGGIYGSGCLIGKDGKDEITVEELSKLSGRFTMNLSVVSENGFRGFTQAVILI